MRLGRTRHRLRGMSYARVMLDGRRDICHAVNEAALDVLGEPLCRLDISRFLGARLVIFNADLRELNCNVDCCLSLDAAV